MMPGARSSFSRIFDEIVLHNAGSQCFLGSGKHINVRVLCIEGKVAIKMTTLFYYYVFFYDLALLLV